MSANGVEEANLYKIVDELISPVGEVTFQEKPKRSPRLEYTLEESKEEAIRFQSEAIGTEHMLLAILREPDSVATRILLTLNVNIQKIMQDTLEVLGVEIKEYQEELQEAYQRKDGILDQYGTCLLYTSHIDTYRIRKLTDRWKGFSFLDRRSRNSHNNLIL